MSKSFISKPKNLAILATLGAFLVVGGLLVAFQRGNISLPGMSPQSEMSKQALEACPFSQEVCTYLIAQSEAMQKGVTITSTSNDPEAKDIKTVIKLDGSQNSSVESYENDKLISHMITFDQVVYFQNPEDNSWYSIGGSTEDSVVSSMSIPSPTEYFEEAKADETEVTLTYLGDEPCGTSPGTCKKYEFITVSPEETAEESDTQIFIWIDPKTNLAQKMEVMTEEITVIMGYEYGSVEISMPSPVSELPGMGFAPDMTGDGVVGQPGSVEGANDNPSSEELMLQFQSGDQPTEQEINQFIRELQQ